MRTFPDLSHLAAASLLFALVSCRGISILEPGKQIARLEHPPAADIHVDGPIFGTRVQELAAKTVDACLDQCESTQRIQNFDVAAGVKKGKFEGYFFNDSDLYKAIEGAAYVIERGMGGKALEKRVESIIGRISRAQQKDGYLNTYFTLTKGEKRFSNTRVRHELYCAGHLIEAGIAWHRATGRDSLLRVAKSFADYIDRIFGPDGLPNPPGHQEIELALFRLADHCNESRYARLARFFLEARGKAEEHGRESYGPYSQDHLPIREQKDAVGHAVRAMYMYCGMAELAAREGDVTLLETLKTLWRDVVDRKMYVTGAIGAEASHEGFAKPYQLPNDEAYCESCASIGLALWADRMFCIERKSEYYDVLERVLYNGLLSGISLSGDRFLYVNPLASRGKHPRRPWYACACCPPNFARYLPQVPGKIYATGPKSLYVLLYAQSKGQLEIEGERVTVEQVTRYPWDGRIELQIHAARELRYALKLRRPGWLKGEARLLLDGRPAPSALTKDGFWTIRRNFGRESRIVLELPMEARREYADPRVKADQGRVALRRGPLIYCIEGVDHGGHARNLVLPKNAALRTRFDKQLFGGIVRIEAEGLRRNSLEAGSAVKAAHLSAIPYQFWDHRGPGEMLVWIPEKVDLAEIPGLGKEVVEQGRYVSASHCFQGDTVRALADRKLAKRSEDHSIPRMTFWPRKGSTEWVGYRYPKALPVRRMRVYWFDDRGRKGGCRIPASYRLLYHDGSSWKEVSPVDAPGAARGIALDQWTEVQFEPVRAKRWRLEVTLQKGWSGGILEWELG